MCIKGYIKGYIKGHIKGGLQGKARDDGTDPMACLKIYQRGVLFFSKNLKASYLNFPLLLLILNRHPPTQILIVDTVLVLIVDSY